MMFITKHFNELLSMDWATIILIMAICGLSSYFLRDYLAAPPMIIFVYPFLVFFSMLAQYIFTQAELYSPKKLDQWLMWTILATIAGNLAGILLAAAFATLRERRSPRRA
jgi:hypothetical protein